MFTFSIRCYNLSRTKEVLSNQIFILNKGLNSGKPLEKSCPNCFVITVKNNEEKEFLFWLCWGLWQSKKFYYLHTGSVIPFIRLKEFVAYIKEQAAFAYNEKQQHQKSIKTLQHLEALEKSYKQNLLLIQNAKRAIFQIYTTKH